MLGMFVGLIAGLAVSLAIAFYLNRTPVPFIIAKGKPAEKEAAAGKPPAIAGMPQGAVPAATPGEKPKFDFYKILPGQEEPVSDKELRERMRTARGQQEGAKDVYFIQAGSFQNPADADNQKARLAILGFESSVEPANLPDKGTWYRVRLGPYSRLEEINRVRQALAQNNIDASLVKIKEQP
jgi:cell division protein FtsN